MTTRTDTTPRDAFVDEVECLARAILSALHACDSGEAYFHAGELLAAVQRARRGQR